MEGSLNILGMQRSCAANVPARHKAAVPSLEAIRASPHYPVVCTPNPSISGNATYNGSTDLTQAMPINGEMIEFENDLWKVSRQCRGFGATQGKRVLLLLPEWNIAINVDPPSSHPKRLLLRLPFWWAMLFMSSNRAFFTK